ncbi:MAG: AMP-binding protein [Candidatus Sumerlaeaceae bacterium]|nr:AMP-binding protein [Candidatus Sumerlaeaceae bacterium]
MFIDFILEEFARDPDRDAIIWRNEPFRYAQLLDHIQHWQKYIVDQNIPPGSVVALEADFSPNGISLFFALVEHACIVVPLTSQTSARKGELLEVAQVEYMFSIDEADKVTLQKLLAIPTHELLMRLRVLCHPGLVIFSSGSSGRCKGAVHDFTRILGKFKVRRSPHRGISFLLFDHIGGVNTMLALLGSGGCLVTVKDRSPDSVLAAVETHRVEHLPISPTFLNLIMLSEAHTRHNLDSLKVISYGTEPMPESLLRRFHALFPDIKLIQLYGMSELGILRTRSVSSESNWVQLSGEDYETRIVNGAIEIKAQTAMLGYLNAPSPFTEDGWLITGDAVEVQGDSFRIIGRKSELINIGGEKVYPAEIEAVLLQMPNVVDVLVYGKPNALTGQIVCAWVKLADDQPRRDFMKSLRQFCKGKLQTYQIPVEVDITADDLHSERFKKLRMRAIQSK